MLRVQQYPGKLQPDAGASASDEDGIRPAAVRPALESAPEQTQDCLRTVAHAREDGDDSLERTAGGQHLELRQRRRVVEVSCEIWLGLRHGYTQYHAASTMLALLGHSLATLTSNAFAVRFARRIQLVSTMRVTSGGAPTRAGGPAVPKPRLT